MNPSDIEGSDDSGSETESGSVIDNDNDNDNNNQNPNPNKLNTDSVKYRLLGMTLVCIATLCVTTCGIISSIWTASFLELVIASNVIQLILAIIAWNIKRKMEQGSPLITKWYGNAPYHKHVFARGIIRVIAGYGWMRGLQLVPIGNGESIVYLGPILGKCNVM
jgi:hypothetical protein